MARDDFKVILDSMAEGEGFEILLVNDDPQPGQPTMKSWGIGLSEDEVRAKLREEGIVEKRIATAIAEARASKTEGKDE